MLGTDIVVTAQKREQRAQDIGIAITAYSGEQLRALNVVDSRELAAFSPGVFLGGSSAGQNAQYTIRGVTQNDVIDIVESPNAVYLDEGYVAIGQGQTFGLFDIDRVEVLKGPQGTLFGRNATGGLIHYVTVKPSLTEVSGFADLRYGIYDSVGTPGAFRGEAALNLPLSSTFAVRVAGLWNKADPLLRNEYPLGAVGAPPGPGAGADLGDDDTLAGRFTALWEPGPGATVTFQVNAARSNLSTGPYQQKPTIAHFNASGELIDVTDVAPGETRASIGANGQDFGSDLNNDGIFGDTFGRPVPGADFFGYRDPDGADFRTSSDFAFADHNRVRTYGGNLTGQFDLSDAVTLTSVSDYKHFEKLMFVEIDAGPTNLAGAVNRLDADSFSQELRLNGKADNLSWAAGAYYLHIDNISAVALKFPVNSLATGGVPLDSAAEAHLITNSYSAFGQVDWAFTPELTLIAGGRLIREEKTYSYFQGIYGTTDSRRLMVGTPIVVGPVFGPNGPEAYTAKSGKTLWAGKLQLEYRPQPGLMLYAGVNRGVKAGSFNGPTPGGLPVQLSQLPYKEEVLVSYEGGFKYSFPDGRTRLNASAYYYDYSDYQAFLFTGVTGIIVNADDTTYGAEAELYTSPLDGLDTGIAVSWFEATVKDVPFRAPNGSGTPPIVRDVKPTYAPQLQGTAYARYSWNALGGRMAIGADAQYSSSFYYNLRNFTADKYGRYVMMNANVSWELAPIQVTFSVKNITDVRAGVQGFDVTSICGCNTTSYKPPRLFQLGLRYEF
ncbi:MAG TPA: TonB-dependent receptor [Sphingobium sp.]|nr:TonB-dependent receptor [Sphingobium sp.]